MATGRNFTVEEAHTLGLVNEILPEADFRAAVHRYAQQFVPPKRAAKSVGMIKRAVVSGLEGSFSDGLGSNGSSSNSSSAPRTPKKGSRRSSKSARRSSAEVVFFFFRFVAAASQASRASQAPRCVASRAKLKRRLPASADELGFEPSADRHFLSVREQFGAREAAPARFRKRLQRGLQERNFVFIGSLRLTMN